MYSKDKKTKHNHKYKYNMNWWYTYILIYYIHTEYRMVLVVIFQRWYFVFYWRYKDQNTGKPPTNENMYFQNKKAKHNQNTISIDETLFPMFTIHI